MEFPRLVYKRKGAKDFEHALVNDAAQHSQYLANGWFGSVPEALAGSASSTASAGKGSSDENAPPTRAELEAKARELGISFQPNIGDKKLRERIEIALGAQSQ